MDRRPSGFEFHDWRPAAENEALEPLSARSRTRQGSQSTGGHRLNAPTKRLRRLDLVLSQEELRVIAEGDRDPDVRAAAVLRITDDEWLVEFLAREQDVHVLGSAVCAIARQEALARVAENPDLHQHPRVMAVLLLNDIQALERLQGICEPPMLRQAVAMRLRLSQSDTTFLRTWMEDHIEDIRHARVRG